jgi:predicted secreted protein
MKWTSIIAIYSLFWVMSAFLVLPFGVRTHDEAGIAKVPGQADSAPANYRPATIAKRATLLALALFALFYANYVSGWVTAKDMDFTGGPPNLDGSKIPEGSKS